MVSKASWRYSFYKAYAAIFYHYFNEIKPLFPEATFSFKHKRHFGYKKKKENNSGIGFNTEPAGNSEKLY